MTKDELLTFLQGELKTLQGWGCIHQDEYGTHYAPDFEEPIANFEDAIETVRSMYTKEDEE